MIYTNFLFAQNTRGQKSISLYVRNACPAMLAILLWKDLTRPVKLAVMLKALKLIFPKIITSLGHLRCWIAHRSFGGIFLYITKSYLSTQRMSHFYKIQDFTKYVDKSKALLRLWVFSNPAKNATKLNKWLRINNNKKRRM